MSAAAWLANDALFEAELSEGHAQAEGVAAKIRDAGVTIDVTPYVMRGNVDERHQFADEYDLLVAGRHRVEVKSRRLRFFCPDDFPYDPAFVYSLRGWQAKSSKPCAIILVSQITAGLAVIPRSTEHLWTVSGVYDRNREITYDVLQVSRDLLRPIEDFVAWVKELG